MARLKYNKCYTFLDGALDAVDTTAIPILDPLKEGGPGGTNIATVVAPDVLVMSIEDEIIHVTAYTTATTTLTTILRGQDGSVAASHPTGARIFVTPGKEDFLETTDIKGTMTVIVAASDAPQVFKDRADYVCDGTNDEVEIQAAIDLIEGTEDRGVIEFSGGTFNVSSELSASGTAIAFQGTKSQGYDEGTGTFIKRIGVGTGLYNVLAVSTSYCEISDIVFFDAADVVNADPLIRVHQGSWTHFERCRIINWNSGIALQMADGGLLRMNGCYVEGATGISHTGTTATTNKIRLDDTEVYGASYAVEWTVGGACRLSIENCEINGGVRADGNISSVPLPDVMIRNTKIHGAATESVYASDLNLFALQDCHIEAETGQTGSCVRISNIDQGIISDNIIEIGVDFTEHGIWALDCDLLQITNNLINSLGNETNATYSGIILDGNTNDCTVQDNKIRSTGTNKYLYGIRVDDSTCDNNTVINNDLRASSAAAGNEFSDAGTGTVAGLEPTLLAGWYQDNVIASQTGVVLNLPLTPRTEITMPADGYVVGIAVRSNEARTAGTLTVDATINGTVTGLTAVLDGTNTQTKTTRQSNSADKFTAGQRIGVKLTTDAGWLPVTADIDVTVLVVYNTANRI